MPDKFIPVDTSEISTYFIRVRPFIYQFALKYTEKNREVLKKFTETGELEKFLDKQGLLDQFMKYLSSNNLRQAQPAGSASPAGAPVQPAGSASPAGTLKPDPKGLKTSGRVIQTQIKAYIARNILDNKGFYPIWEQIDSTLKYAIKYLEKEN